MSGMGYSSDHSVNVVSTGGYSSAPYVNAIEDSARAIDGDVRFNNGEFEVYSCGCWYTISAGTTDITLHEQDRLALEWAREQMKKEEKDKELMERYPALKQAKEKYELIRALVENE